MPTSHYTAVVEIDRSLGTSGARRRAYDAAGDTRSAEIERTVTDRLLDERLAATKGAAR